MSSSAWRGRRGPPRRLPDRYPLNGYSVDAILERENRLGRVVDRRRVVHERLRSLDEETAKAAREELALLARRSRLIYHAIFAAVTAALLICLVVASAFIGALMSVELARLVAVLFVLSMGALIVCLAIFLREIFVAVTESGQHFR